MPSRAKSKSNKPSGRPTTLTPELTQRVGALISAGMTKRGVCNAIMICEATFYDWINRGRIDDESGETSLYSEFLKTVTKAEMGFKLSHLKKIKDASDQGNWKASAWLLEKIYRNEYGRSGVDARVEVTGKDGEPIETESAVRIYLPDNGRDNPQLKLKKNTAKKKTTKGKEAKKK